MIKNFSEDSYEMKCFGCNATDKLTLLAHRRHEKESINGWIVLCDKCWGTFADKQLFLKNDNGTEECGEAYPPNWKHCVIHLNPESGVMHSDGDHSVREWIENKIRKAMGVEE